MEGVPAHGGRVGMRWSLTALPTQAILWFYDYSILFFFFKLEHYVLCHMIMIWSLQHRNMLVSPSGRSRPNRDFWEMFFVYDSNSTVCVSLFIPMNKKRNTNAISSVVLSCTYFASIGFFFPHSTNQISYWLDLTLWKNYSQCVFISV